MRVGSRSNELPYLLRYEGVLAKGLCPRWQLGCCCNFGWLKGGSDDPVLWIRAGRPRGSTADLR